jgi:hypothetical protein
MKGDKNLVCIVFLQFGSVSQIITGSNLIEDNQLASMKCSCPGWLKAHLNVLRRTAVSVTHEKCFLDGAWTDC